MACICFSPFSFLKINNTAWTIASVAEACSCAHSRRITSFVYPCPIIDRMMFITSWSLFHCSLESPHLSRHGNYLLGFFSCCEMLCVSLPFHHIPLPIVQPNIIFWPPLCFMITCKVSIKDKAPRICPGLGVLFPIVRKIDSRLRASCAK